MKKTSFNLLRGKVARTVNAIVYQHMMRKYDEGLTPKQLNEITRLAKDAMRYASDEAEERLFEDIG